MLYNVIKYEIVQRNAENFSLIDDRTLGQYTTAALTHQVPEWMMLFHPQSGFSPPIEEIQRS